VAAARLALGQDAMSGVRPELLPLALLVPTLVALGCALWVRRRRRVVAALGGPAAARRLLGEDLAHTPRRRLALVLAAALALGVAALDPRWGTDAGARGGGDVVLVLDVSNSMLVEDAAPSRLELQRQAAHRLVRALPDARIGVVVFAGRASVLAPPTLDHRAVAMYIDAARPEIAVQTGSAIDAALRQATALLAGEPGRPGSRSAVLLSDGELITAAEERPVLADAARRAAALGITLHTLGIGSPAGGPVPAVDPESGARMGVRTDPLTGEPAVSRLDESTLREIAGAAGGRYHRLRGAADVDALAARLARDPGGTARGAAGAPRYAWLVALALLCLAAEAVVAGRRPAGET
jgi:Ca-activated chloride channel homolog